MGRRNKKFSKDLRQQCYEVLTGMLAAGVGQSKRTEKQTGDIKDKIFSYSTYESYWKCTKQFLDWMKDNHP